MARPRAKDHEDKKKTILSTAAAVFAEMGILGASMNDVAKACGVSKPNIYHYCGSKNELVFVILDTYLRALRDRILGLDLSNASPKERLELLIQEFLLAYEGMDNAHKIQTEGIPLLQPEQQSVLREYQRNMVKCISNALVECAPETLGEDPAKCRDITMSVFGMLNWFYMWSPSANKERRIAYAQTISELTLGGIQAAS